MYGGLGLLLNGVISVLSLFLLKSLAVALIAVYSHSRVVTWIFAARCYASKAYVVRCPSVCPSVTFVNSVKTNKRIFQIFTPSGSQAILVFPYQTAWQHSDGNLPNGSVECRWGMQKSLFWAYIWLHCVMLTLLPARCYQYGAVRPRSRKLWHLSLV